MSMRKLYIPLCVSVLGGLTVIPGTEAQSPLPAPWFGPAGGTYTYNLQVAINKAYPWESIFYTTDGSPPSPSHGIQYGDLVASCHVKPPHRS